MAISTPLGLVGQTPVGSNTIATGNMTVADASLVVVSMANWTSATRTVSTVRDGSANDFTIMKGQAHGTFANQYVYYRYYATGGTINVTVTWSGSTEWHVIIGCHFTGINSTPADATAPVSATGNSAAPTSPAYTPSQNGCLCIGMVNGDSVATAQSPWTTVHNEDGMELAYYIQETAADIPMHAHMTSGLWSAMVGAFAPAEAGGATAVPVFVHHYTQQRKK